MMGTHLEFSVLPALHAGKRAVHERCQQRQEGWLLQGASPQMRRNRGCQWWGNTRLMNHHQPRVCWLDCLRQNRSRRKRWEIATIEIKPHRGEACGRRGRGSLCSFIRYFDENREKDPHKKTINAPQSGWEKYKRNYCRIREGDRYWPT